jgi:lysozyme family protein
VNANLESALRLIRHHEGGYVSHSQDPGGCTNMGITLATYRRIVNPHAHCADLADLDWDTAAGIYRDVYWDAIRGDDLPDGIDIEVMDMAVNAGPVTAAKLLQALVGAATDGDIGPVTLAAVRVFASVSVLIRGYAAARMRYYRGLKHWPAFGHGWERRVATTERAALNLLAPEPA